MFLTNVNFTLYLKPFNIFLPNSYLNKKHTEGKVFRTVLKLENDKV